MSSMARTTGPSVRFTALSGMPVERPVDARTGAERDGSMLKGTIDRPGPRPRGGWAVPMVLMACVLLTLPACVHEPPVRPAVIFDGGGNGGGGGGVDQDPCDPDTVYFQNTVLPLLVSSCAIPGCHDDATAEEGIRFTSHSNIMSSDVLDPGDPGDSDLIEAITETDPDKIMPPPPHQPLTPQQIDMIWTWVAQGAQDNGCSGACDTTNVTYSGTIAPLIAAKCDGCHGGATPSGGLDLTSHAVVNMVALDGRMAGAVQHEAGYEPMPPSGGMLPSCEVDQILLWIGEGAPNN